MLNSECYLFDLLPLSLLSFMDTANYFPPQSPSQLPASHVKYHHPYFSPTEVEFLSEKQRGKLSAPQERLRQQACGFIEAVGLKSGL